MEHVKLNKENWSGEEGTVKLYADGRRFKLDDLTETFRIVAKRYDTLRDEETDEVILEAFHEYKVEVQDTPNGDWRETDIKGTEHHKQTVGDRVLCEHHYEFTSWTGEYGRTSQKDPRLAAAKHLYNVY